jgi:hypothetical protein
MTSISRRNIATATALSVALMLILLSTSEAFKQAVPIIPKAMATTVTSWREHQFLFVRGGDNYDDSSSILDVDIELDEIESSDEGEEEEEEEVEEEEELGEDKDVDVGEKLNPKLARAVQVASSKVKGKDVKTATQSTKAALESTLLASKPKTKNGKSGLAKLFQLPYIVKACLNPFIFIQMTKEYWLSLLNHKYGEKARV